MLLRRLTQGVLELGNASFLPKRALFEQLAQQQQPRVLMTACQDRGAFRQS